MAVLGLLSVAPMTAYGLAEQITRTIGPVWGASRRTLLAEPRRLAAEGLVEAVPAETGSRAGQRWRATARGRRTVSEWLGSPVSASQVSSELALRITFADHGDRDDLRGAVAERRRQIEAFINAQLPRLDDYIDTGGPFPHRLHIVVAVWRYLADVTLAEYDFLDWMDAELDEWPDTKMTSPERHIAALRSLRKEALGAVARSERRRAT
jgi:DNA-binding PadR family transcriptional regulator